MLSHKELLERFRQLVKIRTLKEYKAEVIRCINRSGELTTIQKIQVIKHFNKHADMIYNSLTNVKGMV